MGDRYATRRFYEREQFDPRYRRRDDDYSDDDETQIRIQTTRRERDPPRGVNYIQPRDAEPRGARRYFDGPNMVVSEQTLVRTRSKSRERRSAPSPPERQQQAAGGNQIVINNYNDHSSSSDSESDRSTDVSHRSRHSHHSHHGHGRGMPGGFPQPIPPPPFGRGMPVAPPGPPIRETQMELERTRRQLDELRMRDEAIQREREAEMQLARHREEWEFNLTRRELEDLRAQRSREIEERRREKETREEEELRRAKKELDEIKRREEKEAEEERLAREYEIKRLEKEKKAAEEKAKREKADKEAVERFMLEQAEKERKEREEKERAEKEYQRRLQEDLINSGVDEKHIKAIIKKEKIPEEKPEKPKGKERATYTRMARRHLSIEALNAFRIDFEYDQVRCDCRTNLIIGN